MTAPTATVSMAGYQPPVLRQPEPLPTWGHVSQWSSLSSTAVTPATWAPAWSTTATSAVTTSTGGTLYTFANDLGDSWGAYVSRRAEWRVATGWAQTSSTGLIEDTPWAREQRRIERAVARVERLDRRYLQEYPVRDRLDPARMSMSAMAAFVDEADKRARALLLSVLNPAQRAEFEASPGTPRFKVVSNLGNVFELKRVRTHGVYKLDAQGERLEEWCVTPHGRIPLDDILVMQKLALETDELALRVRANVWAVGGWQRGQMVHCAQEQYSPGVEPDYLRLAAG